MGFEEKSSQIDRNSKWNLHLNTTKAWAFRHDLRAFKIGNSIITQATTETRNA